MKVFSFFSAVAKNISISSSKLNLILKKIKFIKCTDALKFLAKQNTRASDIIWNVFNSAISNSKKLPELLTVGNCHINKGTTLKRVQPRAKGKADFISKKYSHITICLY